MSIILGIESSCDETAIAVVKDGQKVLGEFIASQIDIHREFGGVVPEVACRAHMECMIPGLKKVMTDAGVTKDDIDAIAVTNRPGLIGAVLVGVMAAKGLSLAWGKPLIGVNHVECHIAACRFAHPEMKFPFVALVVSGGHTNIYEVKDADTYETHGQTLDDAAGEAFDKVAKLLDLGFPGGPIVEKTAKNGNPKAYPWKNACLPKDKINFSFSGIKTAVLYAARSQKAGRKGPLLLNEQEVADAAASFQAAAVHALVKRTTAAAKHLGANWIAIGGGVAANGYLREEMKKAADKMKVNIAIPPMNLCTDNAVMIAVRGGELFEKGHVDSLDMPAMARIG